MRGVAIGTAVPSVGAAGTQYASDINTVLQSIKDTIEAKIVVAEIGIDAALDMANKAIYDCDNLKIDNQSAAALTGGGNARRLNAYGGELYWCDGSGNSVKLTDSGSVSGSVGDIKGDYGDSLEEISYSAADNAYAFTDDATNKATLDVKEIKHEDHVLQLFPDLVGNEGVTNELHYSDANAAINIQTAAGDRKHVTKLPLKVGDRIKSITINYLASTNVVFTIEEVWSGSASTPLGTATVSSGTWTTETISSINETIAADKVYYIMCAIPSGISQCLIGGYTVTYDRV